MFFDNLISFAAAQSLTSVSTGTTSMTTYDVTGAGVGVAPNMIGGLTSTSGTLIGFDIGAGDGMAIPEVFWNVTTAFTSGANASLAIALQAAPDSGVGNLPGVWTTLVQTNNIPLTALTASSSGQFQVPPVPPGFGLNNPRFYRLNFVINSTTFTAGAISANLVLNPSQAARIQNFPSNYVA